MTLQSVSHWGMVVPQHTSLAPPPRAPCQGELAEQLKALVLWRDSSLSVRVFALGFYIILVLHSLPTALAYVQVGGGAC